MVASGSHISIYPIQDKDIKPLFIKHTSGLNVVGLAFHDDATITSCDSSGLVCHWSISSGELLKVFHFVISTCDTIINVFYFTGNQSSCVS